MTDTIGYVAPSKQWIRVPRVMLAADSEAVNNIGVASAFCSRRFGAATCTPLPDAEQRIVVFGRAYPIEVANPKTESRFTNFPATNVRMVAFGSVPVQATVHLSLPTDADGLPQGIEAQAVNDWWWYDKGPRAGEYPPGSDYQIVSDSTITGRVVVRLSDVTIDGVRVDVGTRCRTVTPAILAGHGRGYTMSASDPGGGTMPPGSYDPRSGGSIHGTLDVPPFSGCGVSGEDLDPLISAMASGQGFPVAIEQGELGACWTTPPEAIQPETCGQPLPLAFPSRAVR